MVLPTHLPTYIRKPFNAAVAGTALLALAATFNPSAITPATAKSNSDGCDRSCVEAIEAVIRVTAQLVRMQYEHDVAKCEAHYLRPTPEYKACENRAAWLMVKRFFGMAGFGSMYVWYTYNPDVFDNVRNRVSHALSLNKQPVAELSVKPPEVPVMADGRRYEIDGNRVIRSNQKRIRVTEPPVPDKREIERLLTRAAKTTAYKRSVRPEMRRTL